MLINVGLEKLLNSLTTKINIAQQLNETSTSYIIVGLLRENALVKWSLDSSRT